MTEVAKVHAALEPHETLLVLDGMTGQDAVSIAEAFTKQLPVSGFVLTKMDGDARGGAALSLRAVCGAPIRYLGIGEKVEGLEPFHADRLASRILGMGDVLTLVERAQERLDLTKAEALERKLRKDRFTLEDFLGQLQEMKKLGPLEEIVKMLPGVKLPAGAQIDERDLKRTEAPRGPQREPAQADRARQRHHGAGRQSCAPAVRADANHVEALRRRPARQAPHGASIARRPRRSFSTTEVFRNGRRHTNETRGRQETPVLSCRRHRLEEPTGRALYRAAWLLRPADQSRDVPDRRGPLLGVDPARRASIGIGRRDGVEARPGRASPGDSGRARALRGSGRGAEGEEGEGGEAEGRQIEDGAETEAEGDPQGKREEGEGARQGEGE